MKKRLTIRDVASPTAQEDAVAQLRAWIADGRLPAGKQLPSERALAEKLGISRAAARAALLALAGEGLVQSAPRSGWRVVVGRPATARPSLLSRTVAVLISSGFSGSDFIHGRPSWLGATHQSIAETIMRAGYGTLFVSDDQLGNQSIDQIESDPPRGLIVAHSGSSLETPDRLLRALHIGRVPVVTTADHHDWPGCDTVISDHDQGSYDMARWLIDSGARRLLRCRPKLARLPLWLQRRDAGFVRAVTEAGLPLLPPLEAPTLEEAVTSPEEFEQMSRLLAGYLARLLTGADRADAILTLSDGFIAEVARACRHVGLDPRNDILLAGYDHYWAACRERKWEPTPPHVSVDKNDALLGRALADMLLDRLHGRLTGPPARKSIPQTIALPAQPRPA